MERIGFDSPSDNEKENNTVQNENELNTVPAVTVRSPSPSAPPLHRRTAASPGPIGIVANPNGDTVSPRSAHTRDSYGSLSSTHWPGAEDTSYQYEEFFGGTIQCPSCRGAGRIPREKENELVALIPFSDQRLKPRRTKLYVLLAVLICVIIGSLLLFFLLPRNVVLESNMPQLTPTVRHVNKTEQYVFLSVINVFNISNENYYNVEVEQMEVQTFYDQRKISTVTNDTNMNVPLREKRSYSVHINLTFSDDEGFVADYCAEKQFPRYLLLPFQVTMTSKSLGRSEQSTLTTYQHVLCTEPKI